MATPIQSISTDFSRGMDGGTTDYRTRRPTLASGENLMPKPLGALTVRPGSQRFSTATLNDVPNTAMEFVSSSGTGHIFVGCDHATRGTLYEMTPTAFTAQTVPFSLGTAPKLVWDQMHGALWATENTGANPPLFFRGTGTTWWTSVLPRPSFPAIPNGAPITGGSLPGGATVSPGTTAGDMTLTFTGGNAGASADITVVIGTGNWAVTIPNCHTVIGTNILHYRSPTMATDQVMTITLAAGGSIPDTAQPWYRLRFRYQDGSSKASTPLQAGAPTGAGNNKYNLTTIATEVRGDYLGWTLERTKIGGTVAGPFYFVSDGTATTYTDAAADADLGEHSDENVHGEPPHFNGVVAFRDRLVGWVGSTLWVSQAVGDIEATGVANWNALSAIAIGPDDGDTISAVLLQADRLAVLKQWSVWVVEGTDISNFNELPLYKGAGCAGPRSACAAGSVVYFYGNAGMYRMVGNEVEPFGWKEVGDKFATFRAGQIGDVVVKNYIGQQVLVAFASLTLTNDDMLVYDQRFGCWERYTGLYWNDILVQKAGTFGNAQAVVAIDRRDRGGGTYIPWLGFFGFRDEKAADGTAGTAPLVVFETRKIDDGRPDFDKLWDRIQLFVSGPEVSMTATLTLEPSRTVSVNLLSANSTAVWDGSTWGGTTWASAVASGPMTGLPVGTRGRRYSLGVVCRPTDTFTFSGYVLNGRLMPKGTYTRTV